MDSLIARVVTIVIAAIALAAISCPGAEARVDGRNADRGGVGCIGGSIHNLRTEKLSYAAVAVRRLKARKALNQMIGMWFETRNQNGAATVFGVLASRIDRSCRPTHYKVQLPIRPAGSTGWVRAGDVRVRAVGTRITVDLSERRITLFRAGRPVLVTSAVIGAPSTPTPTGQFYVNQRLRVRNESGTYGPGAVGISAFSPVLLSWAQGGPIAIHGTNAPDMIGFAVSHGCLRVRNADARRLLDLAAEGTPVEIRI